MTSVKRKALIGSVFTLGAVAGASGTALLVEPPVPDLPTQVETELVESAMDSRAMAADLKQLVMQVQQGNDWATMGCDEMLPQFMQQWSYALGREAVRRGWKVGYKQGRDGSSAAEAQFMALGPQEPIATKAAQGPDTADLKAENANLKRKLMTQGMELRRLEHIKKQLEFRLPLNPAEGQEIEKLNVWMVGESMREMMWHVIKPYLKDMDPERMDEAKESLTRAIESQGWTVSHDLIQIGWHYGYAAAQETPVIWPQIHGVYKQWAIKYNAFHWDRPQQATDKPASKPGKK